MEHLFYSNGSSPPTPAAELPDAAWIVVWPQPSQVNNERSLTAGEHYRNLSATYHQYEASRDWPAQPKTEQQGQDSTYGLPLAYEQYASSRDFTALYTGLYNYARVTMDSGVGGGGEYVEGQDSHDAAQDLAHKLIKHVIKGTSTFANGRQFFKWLQKATKRKGIDVHRASVDDRKLVPITITLEKGHGDNNDGGYKKEQTENAKVYLTAGLPCASFLPRDYNSHFDPKVIDVLCADMRQHRTSHRKQVPTNLSPQERKVIDAKRAHPDATSAEIGELIGITGRQVRNTMVTLNRKVTREQANRRSTLAQNKPVAVQQTSIFKRSIVRRRK